MGNMKWLVTRYPKPPGTLIALGAILSDPEEPESRLNRYDAVAPKNIDNESLAVQRTIQAEASNSDSVLLKVVQPLLGAGLNLDGKLGNERKAFVDALDVKAVIFAPDQAYMEASVQVPGVQEHVKKSFYSQKLYMIVGVATAKKLSANEETSQEHSAAVSISAAPPGGLGIEATAEARHSSSKKVVSSWKIDGECDFAYRVREFTCWRFTKKVNKGQDRNKGALFHTRNEEDEDEDDDDDEEEGETVIQFNDFLDNDVSGGTSGLLTIEV